MKKAIIIARVSTEEQKEANNSLPAQIHRLESYCTRNDFKIINSVSFNESAYSRGKRKKFDRILDDILISTDHIIVCFDKIDRLSRDIFDKRIGLLYEKAISGDLEVHFISDGQVLNKGIGAAEKFQFSIKLGLAKYYSDAISDNVKRTFQEKTRRGEIIGKAPYGYKNIRDEKDKANVIISPFEAGIVKKIFVLYTTGASSYLSIAKQLQKDYVETFKVLSTTKRLVERALQTPFYYGEMAYKGELYSHKYEIIIEKDIYDLANEKRLGRVKTKDKKHKDNKNAMYCGFLACHDCGCSFSPDKNRHAIAGKKVKSEYYYYCTNSKHKHKKKPPGTNDARITEQLGEVFKSMQIPKEDISWITKALKESHKGKKEYSREEVAYCRRQVDLLQNRIEKAYDDKLDGSITQDLYNKKRKEWLEKKEVFESKLIRISKADNEYYITATYILELASRSHELFLGSEHEQRRQLIGLIFQNLTIKDGNLQYTMHKPFDSIFISAKGNKWGG